MLLSTRTGISVTPSEAIVKGLSDDGGLFIFDNFDKFSFDRSLVGCDYAALAKKVLKFFFNDFLPEQIDSIIDVAYSKANFSVPVELRSFCKTHYLELFHGPTCAFKDMALTVLSGLLESAKGNVGDNSRTLILTATSGDTGSATLSGFLNSDINAIVLYPYGGVSPVQEAQMHHFAKNGSRAIAVKGNFDDCQSLVKKIFSDKGFSHGVKLSSANSINIGRLIPQVVYYMFAYLQLVKKGAVEFGEEIVFSVPTGNFGDILAGFIAKKAGVPISKLICASNANDVLTDFFKTGVYDRKRPFYKTISPSMDILVSSNLERLLYILSNDHDYVADLMKDLFEKGEYTVNDGVKEGFKDFYPFRLSDAGTAKEIADVFDKYSYLIDPHTAVASCGLEDYRKATGFKGVGVVVSTASPYKFALPVSEALGLKETKIFKAIADLETKTKNAAPSAIKDLEKETFTPTVWEKADAEENLKKLICEY